MVKKIYLLLSILLSSATLFAQNGSLRGRVTDAGTHDPLQGAAVHFNENKNAVLTNENGEYILSGVSPGEYKLKIEYLGYKQFEQKIKFKGGQTQVLNVELTSGMEDLQAVNIFGKLDRETDASSRSSEKNANNLINVISAQAMLRSPDINAANVLQRMSGVTIQRNSGGDKAYAVIRGIEPRYNNTLINGVKIASPDSKSRSVSLDIVPSDILQRIEVSKSLTPDMEADAIGGTVNMVFKDAPDPLLFNATGSLGYSAIFFDRKFTDFSKKDIRSKSVYDTKGPTYAAVPSDFSKTNIDLQQKTAPPTGIIGFTYGNRFLKNKLGILIADNYQDQYYGSNSQLDQAVADPKNNYLPINTDITNRTYSNRQLNNGLVIHADYIINDRNRISADNIFLYSYFSQAFTSVDTTLTGGDAGRTLVNNKPVQGTGSIHEDFRTTTNHQTLENFKLDGKHILSKHLLLDWTGVLSDARKNAPDLASYTLNKRITYDSVARKFDATPFYYDGGNRVWQHNEDKDYDGLLNLTYKGKVKDVILEIKAGGLYRHKERNNYQNEYILFAPGGNNSIGSRQQFYDIYSVRDSVINPNGSAGYDRNNYHAFEDITAGYLQFKTTTRKWDIVGGLRAENTSQGYHFLQFVLDAPDNVTKSYVDLLPSLNLKYKLDQETNIRASYFRSLARPGYYELLPISQPLSSDGTTDKGNPNLQHTTADNFDIRYEHFPTADQQLFIGGFYKNLQDPIELSFGGSFDTFMPTNSSSATIYGGEIIYTRFFGNIGVSGNYAYTHSDVNGSKIDPNTGKTVYQHRPLQGQPDHELNLSLEYKNTHKKLFVQLAYQYNGKMLYRINPDLGYDYYQHAQSFLSLSADKTLSKHFTVFGKFNNLLNTPTTVYIDQLLTGHDVSKATGLIGIRYSH